MHLFLSFPFLRSLLPPSLLFLFLPPFPPPSFFPLYVQVIYLLQLYQEGSLGDASVTSLTEYLLTQPILSLVFSGHTPFPPPNGESGDDGEVGEEVTVQRDFDGRRKSVLIKLHCIQSRSVCLSVTCIHLHICIPSSSHTILLCYFHPVSLSLPPRSMQELLVKFEPPDIMGIPPEELKTILSLPGDEHFRSESLDGVASTSGFLPMQMERETS